MTSKIQKISFYKIARLPFVYSLYFPAAGMTEGDGKRIGGIIGFRDSAEFENRLDHELYLSFFGAAVIGEGLFHLEWGVTRDINT